MKQIIAIILFAISATSCGSSANKEKPSAKYEEKKHSLEETERSSPLKFLKIKGNNRSNLVNKVVIEGDITNSATLVSYQDIEVKITFKNEEGAVIQKDIKTLNMTIPPNTTRGVKLKVKRPKGTASVIFDIIGATPSK